MDSTFCKRCGTPLPAEDIQAAQEKLTALIAEGNTAFNEGRTDEAMAVAESACLSNPSSTAALSLKALCHERRGELAEALECADQIVDLNPDSELDKIKRNQLRTKLSVTAQLATQPPDRRSAAIGAIAAVILVICIGIGAAKYSNGLAAGKTDGAVAQNGVIPYTNPASTNQNQSAPPQQPQTQTQPNQPQQPNDDTDNSGQQTNNRPRPTGTFTPRDSINPEDLSVKGDFPIVPPTPPSTNTGVASPTQPKTPATIVTPDTSHPGNDPDPGREDSQNKQPAPDQGPGQVEITISSGHKSNGMGGSVSLGAGGAAALDKIGIQRYQLGSYGAAAASFEQSLRAGGDQVSVNQWLGRCYGQLGKKSDQIDAYKRCVAACQTAISSGSGNKDRVRAIMDTCQQELKVLQGN